MLRVLTFELEVSRAPRVDRRAHHSATHTADACVRSVCAPPCPRARSTSCAYALALRATLTCVFEPASCANATAARTREPTAFCATPLAHQSAVASPYKQILPQDRTCRSSRRQRPSTVLSRRCRKFPGAKRDPSTSYPGGGRGGAEPSPTCDRRPTRPHTSADVRHTSPDRRVCTQRRRALRNPRPTRLHQRRRALSERPRSSTYDRQADAPVRTPTCVTLGSAPDLLHR